MLTTPHVIALVLMVIVNIGLLAAIFGLVMVMPWRKEDREIKENSGGNWFFPVCYIVIVVFLGFMCDWGWWPQLSQYIQVALRAFGH